MIKFEVCAADPEGGKLYRLIIDGKVVREDLPLDEESLGADYAPREMKEGRRHG